MLVSIYIFSFVDAINSKFQNSYFGKLFFLFYSQLLRHFYSRYIIYYFMTAPNRVNLPSLSHDIFLNAKASSYSSLYRESGIRLEEETIGNKQVFHNYGQGQSQFSLAYGSAYIASKMITLKKADTKTKDVAVVGRGINALMTTLELAKRNYRVILYTPFLPVENVKGSGKRVHSGQGLQFWYPGYYQNSDPLKHELLSKLSFEFLQQSIKSNRYQSIQKGNIYINGPKTDQVGENITQFITNKIGNMNIQFGNSKTQQYLYYQTIFIDTDLFIEEVFTQIKLRNVNIVIKQFNSKEDLLNLKEQFIYDCGGIENKVFFDDKDLYTVQNVSISLINGSKTKEIEQIHEPFGIWKSQQNEEGFIAYFSKKGIQVTSSSLKGEDKEKIKEKTEKTSLKLYNYLKQRTTNASKL